MIFTQTFIPGAYIIDAEPFNDDRGWFARTYCKNEFEKIGHQDEWLQINHSYTTEKGSIRGMHFQYPPYAEIKTVRCIAGSVYDVIVDLRESSPTFLKWFGVELSAENKRTIYIPKGMAHGFQVLEDNSQLIYCHSATYNQQSEGAILYNDKMVGIVWPLPVANVSNKDKGYNPLDINFKGVKN
ncbi:dTDP-4-dehydrorhamnose 3,5-epimerase [Mucilaginibacter sp. UYCu711]|uniref:dTDP-4-dehydrorhamnose 3,5-epimerase n=1 Tax=Mucilaginibacter sp. UYCu711 TaxID=3156339 RepID=UPI003D1FA3C1